MPNRSCRLLLLSLATLPVACARVTTGVQATGMNDTYVVTERDSPVNGGSRTAERTALAEAGSHCQSLGQSFVPVSAQIIGRDWQRGLVGDTGVRLTFRCKAADAPDDGDASSGADDAGPP